MKEYKLDDSFQRNVDPHYSKAAEQFSSSELPEHFP